MKAIKVKSYGTAGVDGVVTLPVNTESVLTVHLLNYIHTHVHRLNIHLQLSVCFYILRTRQQN